MADDNMGQKVRQKADAEVIKKYLQWLQENQMKESPESANKFKTSQTLGPAGLQVFDNEYKRYVMNKALGE